VAVSGYSFKIQIRPRFERFERLKKNQFHFLSYRCALERPSSLESRIIFQKLPDCL
jgi:hypothetical protein